jgi:hypothetical protein
MVEPTPSSAGVEVDSMVCVAADREVEVSDGTTVGADGAGEQLPRRKTIKATKGRNCFAQ